MKFYRKLYRAALCAALVSASLLVGGCSTNTAPPATATSETVRPQGTMAAEIDGGAWASSALPVYNGNATAAVLDTTNTRRVVVTGVATDGSMISLTIPDPHVGQSIITATYVTDPLHFAGPGSAQITTYDTINRTISGTFSFTATEHVDSVTPGAPIMIRKVDATNGVFSNFSWAGQ